MLLQLDIPQTNVTLEQTVILTVSSVCRDSDDYISVNFIEPIELSLTEGLTNSRNLILIYRDTFKWVLLIDCLTDEVVSTFEVPINSVTKVDTFLTLDGLIN